MGQKRELRSKPGYVSAETTVCHHLNQTCWERAHLLKVVEFCCSHVCFYWSLWTWSLAFCHLSPTTLLPTQHSELLFPGDAVLPQLPYQPWPGFLLPSSTPLHPYLEHGCPLTLIPLARSSYWNTSVVAPPYDSLRCPWPESFLIFSQKYVLASLLESGFNMH